MSKAISPQQVQAAAREIHRMRRSLAAWLKYKSINDAVLAGRAPSKLPPQVARAAVVQYRSRNPGLERALADRLHALLADTSPDLRLPDPASAGAAVELAQIALDPSAAAAATGGMAGWWTSWPVLIVGGVALVAVIGIRTYADMAADHEKYACIKAGACTDYGFWLKAVAVAVGAWFVWEKVGVGERVKRHVASRRDAKSLPAGKKL